MWSPKYILLRGLFPSSVVARLVLNIMLPLCPVHAVYIILYFNPTLSKFLLHESFHLVFCHPHRLFPDTGATIIHLNTCPSSHLLTCPYTMALPLCSSLSLHGATLTYLLTCSFLIFIFLRDSTHPSQHPHLVHLYTLFSWLFVVEHIYGPYINADLIFQFSFTGIFLPYITPLHSFQFPHAALTLYMSYLHIHIPPLSFTTAPGEKLFPFVNYSTDIFTVCRSTLSACSNPHSIRCVFAWSILTPIPLSSSALLRD